MKDIPSPESCEVTPILIHRRYMQEIVDMFGRKQLSCATKHEKLYVTMGYVYISIVQTATLHPRIPTDQL